jgi:hypothetical protein
LAEPPGGPPVKLQIPAMTGLIQDSSRILFCQVRTDGLSASGDSGSPVFRFVAGAGPNQVALYGMLFAGNPSGPTFVFSKWVDIVSALGSIETHTPPLTAWINGPSFVHPNSSSCLWNGGASGGSGSYSYQWSGVLSGSGSSITGAVSQSGYLYLTVTSGGQQIQEEKYITSSTSNDWCPE